MSLAEGTPDILRPFDPGSRDSRRRARRDAPLWRGAIIAAALVHAVVIAAVVVRWPALLPVVPPPHPPIPVTLVTLPPRPAPRAPPPPPLRHDLVSGPDTETTAPPQAAEKGTEAAPQPDTPPPVETQTKNAEAPPKPKPAPEIRPPKPKLATRETAPELSRKPVLANRAPGEKDLEGDPYLNHLFELIVAHRSYPANAIGSLGLRLQGIGTYLVAIGADGTLQNIAIERTAGAPILDQTAIKMIEEATPFPPPPNYLPHPTVFIEVTLEISPGAG
ncbi:MAG TPA: TonB family protein [Stellaceae bacterium]